jgi:hypothetical protein
MLPAGFEAAEVDMTLGGSSQITALRSRLR